MGLDVAIYEDDDESREIVSLRLGNLDAIVHLREQAVKSIGRNSLLVRAVLYSAFHCGDRVELELLAELAEDLARLRQCTGDPETLTFAVEFGAFVQRAMELGRPVVF